MKIEDQTSEFERGGHKVHIGPVESEPERSHGSTTGRNRHFRRIHIDGLEVGRSQGKSLENARYNSAFLLEDKIRRLLKATESL
jgi:hypothetical protein